jgi:hypothetical protein
MTYINPVEKRRQLPTTCSIKALFYQDFAFPAPIRRDILLFNLGCIVNFFPFWMHAITISKILFSFTHRIFFISNN